MATPQELQRLLVDMQGRMDQLAAEAAAARQEAAQARAAAMANGGPGPLTPDMLATIAAAVAQGVRNAPAPAGRRTLMDTRGLGRPPTFGTPAAGQLEAEFRIWSQKTENFVVAATPRRASCYATPWRRPSRS